MSQPPLRKCAEPGCTQLVRTTRCDQHAKSRSFDARPSSSERGYTHRWAKFRKQWLAKHPLCVSCLAAGRTVPATDLDHIKPHRGDPVAFWADIENNVQGLCRTCHNKKTAAGR